MIVQMGSSSIQRLQQQHQLCKTNSGRIFERSEMKLMFLVSRMSLAAP
jgi:hypothetical protein